MNRDLVTIDIDPRNRMRIETKMAKLQQLNKNEGINEDTYISVQERNLSAEDFTGTIGTLSHQQQKYDATNQQLEHVNQQIQLAHQQLHARGNESVAVVFLDSIQTKQEQFKPKKLMHKPQSSVQYQKLQRTRQLHQMGQKICARGAGSQEVTKKLSQDLNDILTSPEISNDFSPNSISRAQKNHGSLIMSPGLGSDLTHDEVVRVRQVTITADSAPRSASDKVSSARSIRHMEQSNIELQRVQPTHSPLIMHRDQPYRNENAYYESLRPLDSPMLFGIGQGAMMEDSPVVNRRFAGEQQKWLQKLERQNNQLFGKKGAETPHNGSSSPTSPLPPQDAKEELVHLADQDQTISRKSQTFYENPEQSLNAIERMEIQNHDLTYNQKPKVADEYRQLHESFKQLSRIDSIQRLNCNLDIGTPKNMQIPLILDSSNTSLLQEHLHNILKFKQIVTPKNVDLRLEGDQDHGSPANRQSTQNISNERSTSRLQDQFKQRVKNHANTAIKSIKMAQAKQNSKTLIRKGSPNEHGSGHFDLILDILENQPEKREKVNKQIKYVRKAQLAQKKYEFSISPKAEYISKTKNTSRTISKLASRVQESEEITFENNKVNFDQFKNFATIPSKMVNNKMLNRKGPAGKSIDHTQIQHTMTMTKTEDDTANHEEPAAKLVAKLEENLEQQRSSQLENVQADKLTNKSNQPKKAVLSYRDSKSKMNQDKIELLAGQYIDMENQIQKILSKKQSHKFQKITNYELDYTNNPKTLTNTVHNSRTNLHQQKLKPKKAQDKAKVQNGENRDRLPSEMNKIIDEIEEIQLIKIKIVENEDHHKSMRSLIKDVKPELSVKERIQFQSSRQLDKVMGMQKSRFLSPKEKIYQSRELSKCFIESLPKKALPAQIKRKRPKIPNQISKESQLAEKVQVELKSATNKKGYEDEKFLKDFHNAMIEEEINQLRIKSNLQVHIYSQPDQVELRIQNHKDPIQIVPVPRPSHLNVSRAGVYEERKSTLHGAFMSNPKHLRFPSALSVKNDNLKVYDQSYQNKRDSSHRMHTINTDESSIEETFNFRFNHNAEILCKEILIHEEIQEQKQAQIQLNNQIEKISEQLIKQTSFIQSQLTGAATPYTPFTSNVTSKVANLPNIKQNFGFHNLPRGIAQVMSIKTQNIGQTIASDNNSDGPIQELPFDNGLMHWVPKQPVFRPKAKKKFENLPSKPDCAITPKKPQDFLQGIQYQKGASFNQDLHDKVQILNQNILQGQVLYEIREKVAIDVANGENVGSQSAVEQSLNMYKLDVALKQPLFAFDAKKEFATLDNAKTNVQSTRIIKPKSIKKDAKSRINHSKFNKKSQIFQKMLLDAPILGSKNQQQASPRAQTPTKEAEAQDHLVSPWDQNTIKDIQKSPNNDLKQTIHQKTKQSIIQQKNSTNLISVGNQCESPDIDFQQFQQLNEKRLKGDIDQSALRIQGKNQKTAGDETTYRHGSGMMSPMSHQSVVFDIGNVKENLRYGGGGIRDGRTPMRLQAESPSPISSPLRRNRSPSPLNLQSLRSPIGGAKRNHFDINNSLEKIKRKEDEEQEESMKRLHETDTIDVICVSSPAIKFQKPAFEVESLLVPQYIKKRKQEQQHNTIDVNSTQKGIKDPRSSPMLQIQAKHIKPQIDLPQLERQDQINKAHHSNSLLGPMRIEINAQTPMKNQSIQENQKRLQLSISPYRHLAFNPLENQVANGFSFPQALILRSPQPSTQQFNPLYASRQNSQILALKENKYNQNKKDFQRIEFMSPHSHINKSVRLQNMQDQYKININKMQCLHQSSSISNDSLDSEQIQKSNILQQSRQIKDIIQDARLKHVASRNKGPYSKLPKTIANQPMRPPALLPLQINQQQSLSIETSEIPSSIQINGQSLRKSILKKQKQIFQQFQNTRMTNQSNNSFESVDSGHILIHGLRPTAENREINDHSKLQKKIWVKQQHQRFVINNFPRVKQGLQPGQQSQNKVLQVIQRQQTDQNTVDNGQNIITLGRDQPRESQQTLYKQTDKQSTIQSVKQWDQRKHFELNKNFGYDTLLRNEAGYISKQQEHLRNLDSGLNTESYTFYQETTLNSFRKDLKAIQMVDTQQDYNKAQALTQNQQLTQTTINKDNDDTYQPSKENSAINRIESPIAHDGELPLLKLPASRNMVAFNENEIEFNQSMLNTVDKMSVVNLGTESNHKSPLSNFNSCDLATRYDFLQQTGPITTSYNQANDDQDSRETKLILNQKR